MITKQAKHQTPVIRRMTSDRRSVIGPIPSLKHAAAFKTNIKKKIDLKLKMEINV